VCRLLLQRQQEQQKLRSLWRAPSCAGDPAIAAQVLPPRRERVRRCRVARRAAPRLRMSYEYALLLTVICVALGMPVMAWVFRKIKHSQDVH
jgi:hypothetical protein